MPITVLFPFGGLSRFCTSPAGGSIAGRSRKLSGIDMMLAIDCDVKFILLLCSLVIRNVNAKDKRSTNIPQEAGCPDRSQRSWVGILPLRVD